MDLEEFDKDEYQRPSEALLSFNDESTPKEQSSKVAVNALDDVWYQNTSRRGRWMDIIGDYAGSEPFIICGESLIQNVLDDKLVAIARPDEPSLQILHAKHALESTLARFLERGASFSIALWNDTRLATSTSSGSPFVQSSRSLAQAMLRAHLVNQIGASDKIRVLQFAGGLEDDDWTEFYAREKPMFIMANDGGLLSSGAEPDSILLQRVLVFELLARGIAVTLLQGTEFRDSKIFSWVYEQRLDPTSREKLPASFWKFVSSRRTERASQFSQPSPTQTSLVDLGREVVRLQGSLPLLYAYLFHIVLLGSIGVEQRARPLEVIHSGLNTLLLDSFLPVAFAATENIVGDGALDIDGRVFVSLLHFLIEKKPQRAGDVLGQDASAQVDAIFTTLNIPVPSFAEFASQYPSPPSVPTQTSKLASFRLMAFDNKVFNEALSIVNVPTETSARAAIVHGKKAPKAQAVASADDSNEPDSPSSDWDDSDEDEEADEDQEEEGTIVNDGESTVTASATVGASASSAEFMEFNGQGTVFADTQHWHNKKSILPSHLGGKDNQKLEGKQRTRALRAEQRFMATLQRQAQTLTGALGIPIKQIVVPSMANQSSAKPKPGKVVKDKPVPAAAKPGKKVKEVKLSSADKLRQEISKKKTSNQDDSSQGWWQEQLDEMKKLAIVEKLAYLSGLSRNKRSEEKTLACEMALYRLNIEFLQWIDDDKHDTPEVRDQHTVSIMRGLKGIYDRRTVTPTIAGVLSGILVALGFSDYIDTFNKNIDSDAAEDRPLSFEFSRLLKSKSKTAEEKKEKKKEDVDVRTKSPVYSWMEITEDPIIWQLRVFGEYMDRSMDSAPDSRVVFNPDAWQRQVLDTIDAEGSLLVVAPTSAGKTFISYYAMEKVLRASDEAILVYVAPTKALVTQIAAEVYARFSKQMDGTSCWAVHTRDYRIHNPQKCQILVTVPEMLSIMLLSPPLARVWTPRIKVIVLDEIHSIGQQEGGAIWEQIILLAPCPIIGLSATVGEPEKFNAWLASVQKSKGYTHTYINHPHRYSHLRKSYYALQEKPTTPFRGLDAWKSTGRARFLHPIAMLSGQQTSLPSDLALESGDALRLHAAMLSCKDRIAADLEALSPTKFFSGTAATIGLLRQKDIVRYESALKAELTKLMQAHQHKEVDAPLNKIIGLLEDPVLQRISPTELNTAPSRGYFKSNILHLVCDLQVTGDLPCILFNFDRTECEIIAKAMLTELETTEAKWRKTSPDWKRKLAEYEAWKLKSKDRERLAAKAKKQKKDADAGPETNSNDHSWEANFDEDDPSAQFSFAGTHTSYSKTELDDDLNSLKWGLSESDSYLIDALKRGIAIHHAGCNKRYRSLVESLFRLGFIRVVVATGTLALGINAPTRTSVFCGDSPYLTALMYRQCAGRAGRRGFDLLGKVLFYGLAMDRVQRLVLSKLPSLGGNFPLTSTLTLRLFNLLEGSEYAPVAVDAIKSLMALPRISFGSETGRDQLLHHLRFSIEYLRRARLLNEKGSPMNLFAIASHLYYQEPSNFALVACLRNGILHRICNQSSFLHAKRDLVTLFAHLFGRRYLNASYSTPENVALISAKSPSMIVLPPLSPNIRKTLLDHEREILDVFSSYALAYATEHNKSLGKDDKLPLSRQSFGESTEKSPFHQHLDETKLKLVARSPFVAGSGHDDTFKSVSELARTARAGLHLNEHAIPSVRHIAEEGPFRINAYILDFYTHGQTHALAVANGIRRGDVWFLLQDTCLAMMTVKTSIEQLLLKASQETAEAAEAGEMDVGGGLDPGEADRDGGDDDAAGTFKRPANVTDQDWKVYEVVNSALIEFEEKFKAMWA